MASADTLADAAPTRSARRARLAQIAAALGPGLVVMLADTDAGSVITAAQSGAHWGYRLLGLQLLLMPVLFIVQELAARLGLATGLGYCELVHQRFGRTMSALSVAALTISCLGALVTEMSGLAGVGVLFGVPVASTLALLVGLLFVMAWTGSYRSLERIAIAMGAFELAFVVVAWKSHPDPAAMLAQAHEFPWREHDFLYLVAANIGTCVMPWTVMYQQSALIGKGLDTRHLRIARLDTALGALLCQGVTAAVLIAGAAGIARAGTPVRLESVTDIAAAFTQTLGAGIGHAVFALGFAGGALVATIVVCLTAAWAIGEWTGHRHALERHPTEAPWFYAAFAAIVLAAAALVGSGVNLVRIAIATGAVNAILLPIVLGGLYWFATSAIAPPHRLRGIYAWTVGAVFVAVAILGLVSGLIGLWG